MTQGFDFSTIWETADFRPNAIAAEVNIVQVEINQIMGYKIIDRAKLIDYLTYKNKTDAR